jgi:peptidoglycan/xylan/chitin deacetylase (PgdA/CDA1 family)
VPRERIARALLNSGALDLVFAARRRMTRPGVAALTYHHIAEPTANYRFDDDVADATPAQFRRHLELLARHCTPIGVDELCAGLDGEPLPPNPVMITFDDGYRSNVEVALPMLRELGMPAVFFIATRFVTERRLYWWEALAYIAKTARVHDITLGPPKPMALDLRAPDAIKQLQGVVKRTVGLDVDRFVGDVARAADVEWTPVVERELADQLIMTWDQIRTLAGAGMDIESHTRRHRVLQTLADDELDDELRGSRLDLERECGRAVRAVAYPVGRSIAAEPRIRHAVAAAGYRVGFTNASGINSMWRGVDAYDVRRCATDRAMSDPLLLAQVAVPNIAYVSGNHGAGYNR